MGKKSRARVAAAGTRKDPGRRVAEGKKADRAEKDKKVGAHAHPEWAPHLNSASEDLTAKLFTLVEVILGVVPLVVIGLFLASKDATSVDKLTEVFSQDPSMVVSFISACLQPFVAYMLYMVYRKYCEGDAGFAAGNLIGLLCSEILLLNIPGVIGMGILLWRVWRNVAPHFESWLFERRAMGVLADIAGLARDSSLGVYVRHRRPRSRRHVVCPHRPRSAGRGNLSLSLTASQGRARQRFPRPALRR